MGQTKRPELFLRRVGTESDGATCAGETNLADNVVVAVAFSTLPLLGAELQLVVAGRCGKRRQLERVGVRWNLLAEDLDAVLENLDVVRVKVDSAHLAERDRYLHLVGRHGEWDRNLFAIG